MRTLKVLLLAALLWSAWPGQALADPAPPDTYAYYGDLTIDTPEFHRTFANTFDLTVCDLQVLYTLDLSQVVVPGDGTTPYAGLGVGDRNGLEGAMLASAPFGNQAAPDRLNLNDKLNLIRPGSVDERDYDATGPDTVVAPFGAHEHVGIWYDRDGVGGLTNLPWGYVNKGNFNTAGKYNVAVTFHSINGSRTQGTMFATVNKIAAGFYLSGYQNAPPAYYPAGMGFSGRLSDLNVEAGLTSSLPGFGQVRMTGISAVGCAAVRYHVWLPALNRP